MADNELLPVTQADREAAAKFGLSIHAYAAKLLPGEAKAVRAGQLDSTALVQLLARHRLATADNAELVGALCPPLSPIAASAALETLMKWRADTPLYDGDDSRALHYRNRIGTIDAAIVALARTEQQP